MAKAKKTTPVVKTTPVDKKQNLSKDLKKASKSAAKVVLENTKVKSPEVSNPVTTEVAETVAETVIDAVIDVIIDDVIEAPVREKSVAEVQQEYVDKVKNQIAEANKAKADWLAKIANERQVAEAMKKEEEEKAPKVEVETIEAPAEVEAVPEMTTQEAILDKYLKTRGSYTDVNHYELANSGFDVHALDSNLTCVIGRFTLTRPYVGGYWNVTEKN